MIMKNAIRSLFSSVLFIATVTMVNAGYFRDDRGREFNFVGKPRVVSRAATGLISLYHMGMREDQITATFGLWSIRGSDLDVGNPEAGSRYPESDPTPEEVEFLSGLINLSPSCYTNPRGCTRWDNTSIVQQYKSEFDYILFIDNGNDPNFPTIENETGIPVVFVDTFYDYSPDCRLYNFSLTDERKKSCFGRSMIDIAKRIEELAIALGADVDTERIERDKKAACDAASVFTDTMKQKQEEGVRFVTSINAIKKDDDGNDFFEFRTLDPIDLWVPRTLEELGMPLLHHDEHSLTLETVSTRVSSSEYFIDCPEGELSEDCNSNTMYPVDFWIWDSRSYLNIIGVEAEILKTLFPDKAIIAGQHWHYARNDGTISYDSIARMLTTMTLKVKDAQRLHDRTPCVDIDPKTAVTAQNGGGLERNQYICYNESLIQKEYLTCDTVEAPQPNIPFAMCFSGDNTVTVENVGAVEMSDLSIGDMVLVGENQYEPIYSFGHKNDNASAEYIKISTDVTKNPIKLSAAHMISIEGDRYVPASSVKKGDMIQLATGESATVKNTKTVTREGAYAPFTRSGKLVVNDVVVSNYIAYQGSEYIKIGDTQFSLSYQWIAHTFNSAHRLAVLMGYEGESYTAEGVSHWVDMPHKLFKWVLEQNAFVSVSLISAALAFFMLTSFIELVLLNPVLMTAVFGMGTLIAYKKIGRKQN